MIGNIARFELRLSRSTLLGCAAGTFLFQALLPAFYEAARPEDFSGLLKLVPQSIRTFFGGEYLDVLTVSGFLAFAFTHPLNLLFLCAPGIALASRTASGGAEEGRADLVLSQPVSRSFVFLSRQGAGAACAAVLALCMWLGHLLGTQMLGEAEIPPRLPFAYAAANAFFFAAAVQSVAFLAAAACRLRSSAVGMAITALAVMFFLRLAAGFWPVFDIPAQVSVFTFYVPARVVLAGAFPWHDAAALTAVFAAAAALGLGVFVRKDI